ncbi:MAG: hypothetical protein A3J93_01470 [Candidatus Magasanikbacteria bacterium RIFOXYC2_FULL_42_28]|uniref:Uncharacterized protein n=1 Tax=Candidatus Magasanikbacteria bacterium RIFOXYC2_FULL_42_28 TaxID=1798704 RepID=A0A1F6NYK8_9BACT|nr:MAG: hypothetical protein A3J93_01470 [Candidatus Magasanikbacteria bacterium RIFOXYC2_FULL_42_28]
MVAVSITIIVNDKWKWEVRKLFAKKGANGAGGHTSVTRNDKREFEVRVVGAYDQSLGTCPVTETTAPTLALALRQVPPDFRREIKSHLARVRCAMKK